MPRGRPRKHHPMQEGRDNGSRMSKMDAVRQTLAELGSDAKPLEIKEHLRSRYSISMEPGMISNYKSTIKSGGKSSLIRRPKGAHLGDFSIEDIQAVKAVADRIGAEKVKQLAHVLAK
jgi:hypothetical protein